MLATIAAKEAVDQNGYVRQPETAGTAMPAPRALARAGAAASSWRRSRAGLQGSFLGRLEGRHRAVGGNALRAAVLGANDGLCSNLSLVMGVAGAAIDSHGILVTGLAGLLAGAGSMALGEWVSVTSARELAQREIRIEASELARGSRGRGRGAEADLRGQGLEPERGRDDGPAPPRRSIDRRRRARPRGARHRPEAQLGGSAWEAAVASFVLFALGAVVPILPFLVSRGTLAVASSAVVSALALFALGAAITVFTGASAWRAGGRQLLLGLAAAGLTFGVGRLIGIAIAGG